VKSEVEAVQHILSMIGTAAMSVAIWLGLASAPTGTLYQGYVEGDYVLVSPTSGGKLVSLAVQRGDYAETGIPLFALDPTQESAARDEAAAALQQSQDKLANLEKGKRAPEVQAIEAQIAQARAQLQLSSLNLTRQQKLKGSSAFSQERLDQARADYDLQGARVKQLKAELASATMTLGRAEEVNAARSEVAANVSALDQAQWRLDQRTVHSPATGLVTDTYFDPGEYVGAGQAVVQILPPENTKVRFFVPETDLAAMRIGETVAIHCDGCKSDIPADILYISPTAEFTPPVLYNRENRNRLVFMVEAYPKNPKALLRPGQPVDVIPASP
jgi:HlyD family secretion protein